MVQLGPLQLSWDMLPSALLVAAWLLLIRAMRYSGWRLALVSLVGTIGHELCHLVCGLLLGARPTSFSILPKRQGNTWVLGAVGFRGLNLLNAAPVAFAPLLLLGLAGVLFVAWSLPDYAGAHYGVWLLSGYVVACCLSSCLPSTMDIKLGWLSALFYTAVGGAIWWLVRLMH